VRLLTFVLVLPYRHPALTAKALATLHVLSGGRLTVDVGAGSLREEFDALGIPFAQRNRLMDDALEVITRLWSSDLTDIHGVSVSQFPNPVQSPGPPVWAGGNSSRAIARAVAWGDAWIPFFNNPSTVERLHTGMLQNLTDLGARIDELRRVEAEHIRPNPVEVIAPPMLASAGGTNAPARTSVPPLSSANEIDGHLRQLRGLGVAGTTVRFTGRSVAEQVDQIEHFGERFCLVPRVERTRSTVAANPRPTQEARAR